MRLFLIVILLFSHLLQLMYIKGVGNPHASSIFLGFLQQEVTSQPTLSNSKTDFSFPS